MIDMKDSPPGKKEQLMNLCFSVTLVEITNSFRIVKDAESTVYRAETTDLKRSWVAAIKRVMDDVSNVAKKLKKDSGTSKFPIEKIHSHVRQRKRFLQRTTRQQ